MDRWKEQLEYFMGSTHHQEFNGIDGEPFEFEWYLFPGHTTVELLREIQMRKTTRGIKPEKFEDRIIFMSMYNDIVWSKGEADSNERFCALSEGQRLRKQLSEGTLVFLRSW